MNSATFLPGIWTQTYQVALLASVVWLLCRLFARDRPHVAHALWAIVLLKCVTPPIIASPISLFGLVDSRPAPAFEIVEPSPPVIPSREIADEFAIAPTTMLFVQADLIESLPIFNADSEKTKTMASSWPSPAAFVMWIWLAGFAVIAVVTAIRMHRFLNYVRQNTLPTPDTLRQHVQTLSRQLKLRHHVRVRLVDGKFGPAVVGLIRPTILLPKLIIADQRPAQVRLLIAHELIHIRRGDLSWAAVQAVAVCVGWFHPFAWLAERMLTREAERCCDEETIASLGCRPSDYARSLLDVLERKQTLRAAPSLPGIRPVEITSNRMERIMKIGHGSHPRRPWWAAALLLLGAAVALPSSAWGLPQERQTTPLTPATTTQNPANTTKPLNTRIQSSPAGNIPSATAAVDGLRRLLGVPKLNERGGSDHPATGHYSIRTFEVGPILERLQDDTGIRPEDAPNALLNRLPFGPQMHRPKGEGTTLHGAECVFVIEGTGETCQLGNTEPTMKILDDKLYAFEVHERLDAIGNTLKQYERFGFKLFSLDIDVYECSLSDLALLGLAVDADVSLLSEGASGGHNIMQASVGSVRSDLGVAGRLVVPAHGTHGLVGARILSPDQEIAFLERLEKAKLDEHSRLKRVNSPRITVVNGASAAASMGSEVPLVTSYRTAKGDAASSKAPQPVVTKYSEGLHIDATVEHQTGKTIELSFGMRKTQIDRVDEFEIRIDGESLKVQQPKMSSTIVNVGMAMSCGDTFASYILPKVENDGDEPIAIVALVRCEEVAPMAPQVKPGDVPKDAWIGVSDKLSEDEIAEMTARLKAEGFEGITVVDSQLKVRPAEDWKRAAEIFQTIRRERESAASDKDAESQTDAEPHAPETEKEEIKKDASEPEQEDSGLDELGATSKNIRGLIRSIELIGNDSIPTDRILSMLATREGQLFNDRRLQRDIQTLYRSKLFRRVSVGTIEENDGLKIRLQLQESPGVEDALREFDSQSTKYERVKIVGPLTAGGNAVALEPPSDAQVLNALRKSMESFRQPRKFDDADVHSIIKVKIADYVDRPKFVPLIGMAQLHHAHYKCTIRFKEVNINGWPIAQGAKDAPPTEVVYIDHNHFHMSGDPLKAGIDEAEASE